ncbi:MAG: LptA/OstA family protein [Limisphaerales bacterium]
MSTSSDRASSATNAPSRFQAVTFDKRSNRKKSFLTSEDVIRLPDGRPLLVKPRLTMFRDDGSVAWIAEPTECVYDEKGKVAFSTNRLHAFTADKRFDIEGVGFQLRLEDSHLFLSNQVHTLIRKPAPTNALAAAEAPLEIFSDHFDYVTGLAIYRGHVRADDPEGRLTCELLTAHFASQGGSPGQTNETGIETIVAERQVVLEQKELRATGDTAVYTATNNLIAITGHPEWRQGTREGRGDRLLVNRTTRAMNATGHVFMKLPRDPANPTTLFSVTSAAPANGQGATNQPIEITADQLDYRPGAAVFRSHVEAGDATGKLTCEIMTVSFVEPGNQVATLVAEQDVVITNLEEGSRATGERAVFTATNSLVELTGHPRWSAPQQEGQAERLAFDTKARSFAAYEHVVMTLASRGTNQPMAFLSGFSAATNATIAPRQPTRIFADRLDFKRGLAAFHGHPRVDDPPGSLRCEDLTMTFIEPGNRIKIIVADGHVDAWQAESQLVCDRLTANYLGATGQLDNLVAERSVEIFTQQGTNRVHATGTKGVYTAANNTMELTGHPVLQVAQSTSSGELLVWDRAVGALRMKGISHSVVNHSVLDPKKPAVVPGKPARL